MSFDTAKLALEGTRFSDLRHVAETGSTNVDMRSLLLMDSTPAPQAARGAGASPVDPPESGGGSPAIVLVADHQNAGRGRMDRSWDAPAESSILMSIGLPVGEMRPERLTLLTMALSLAVVEAVHLVGVAQAQLKWPNDIVVGDPEPDSPLGYKKVGGILAELVSPTVQGACVVLGLGLNVNWLDMPNELARRATSLATLAGKQVDRSQLVADILLRLDREWLPSLLATDLDGFLDAYCRHSATIGELVRIELPDASFVGRASGVTASGALLVEVDGVERTVTAGDLVHLRPAR